MVTHGSRKKKEPNSPRSDGRDSADAQDSSSKSQSRSNHGGDLTFVQRLIAEDGQAWMEFLDRYTGLIRARVSDVARSFGFPNEASIDDAASDVLTACLDRDMAVLRSYQGRSSLSTFLAVIATRSATRGFARQARQIRKEAERTQQFSVDDVSVQNADDQIHYDEILCLLKELPERQQQIVRLYYLESKSYREISEVTKIPIGSIGVTLKRAEAKLREQWNES